MSNNNNINLIVKANSNQKEFKEFLNQSISVEEVNNSEKPIWRLSNVIKPYRKSVTKDEEENQFFNNLWFTNPMDGNGFINL
jgi:pantothenate kinase